MGVATAHSDRSVLTPLEQKLPGVSTQAGSVVRNIGIAASVLSYGVYWGGLGALLNRRALAKEWGTPQRGLGSKLKYSLFPSIILPAAAGLAYGMYALARGHYSPEAMDRYYMARSEEFRAGVLRSTAVLTEGSAFDQLNTIFRRIVEAAHIVYPHSREYNWTLTIAMDDTIANAFCLPGGYVTVYSGMLKAAETEAAIAGILGHEMGHALARHSANSYIFGKIVQDMASLVTWPLALYLNWHDGLLDIGMTLVSGVLWELPHSRQHEMEADEIGFALMARAGYDPNELIRLWNKLGQHAGRVALLSTHPSTPDREEKLRNLLPEVMPMFQSAPQPVSSERLL